MFFPYRYGSIVQCLGRVLADDTQTINVYLCNEYLFSVFMMIHKNGMCVRAYVKTCN